jgi:hypothetical protein
MRRVVTMELFLPSVIVLLLAAAVVFFMLPRFGPATLALVSAALLGLGLYQHYTTFGTEYRFSTWQFVTFAPYLMIGGLLLVIAIFLLYTIPVAGAAAAAAVPNIEIPGISNMPPANTSTNVVTSAINNSLNTAANLFGVNNKKNNILNTIANNYLPNFNRNRNNKGLNFPFSQV